ncbi:helix-turn-helix domain-containing protein [Planococcus soli]|uniref:helix-turn-helix domain-containing protein n=1 Tax=Planococcus soli TaxID=2666072 RepID=UPI00163D6DA9|nr:helix-turn-helix transcriptional regulator [Planococcus soli]
MDVLVKLVGANIKAIRMEKGWSREQLAERCGVQVTYLAGVERGERNITLQTLENLAEGLEEPPVAILEFKNLKVDKEHVDRKELLTLLVSKLNKRSLKETQLAYKILDNIFDFIDK